MFTHPDMQFAITRQIHRDRLTQAARRRLFRYSAGASTAPMTRPAATTPNQS